MTTTTTKSLCSVIATWKAFHISRTSSSLLPLLPNNRVCVLHFCEMWISIYRVCPPHDTRSHPGREKVAHTACLCPCVGAQRLFNAGNSYGIAESESAECTCVLSTNFPHTQRQTDEHTIKTTSSRTLNCHFVPVFCLSKRNSNFPSCTKWYELLATRISPFCIYAVPASSTRVCLCARRCVHTHSAPTIVLSSWNKICFAGSVSRLRSTLSTVLGAQSAVVFTFTLRLNKHFTRYVRVLLCVRFAYGAPNMSICVRILSSFRLTAFVNIVDSKQCMHLLRVCASTPTR